MNFEIEPLDLSGVAIVRSKKISDIRGYFMETWSRKAFTELNVDCDFVQDNESLSVDIGTIRGLHFQRAPFEQAKLVRVLSGTVFSVVVDIRAGSATFGKWCAATLTGERREQLYVPRGFAHGFATLEANTLVIYKVDAPYSAELEDGILWSDPNIAIRWPFRVDECILSEKDRVLPLLATT